MKSVEMNFNKKEKETLMRTVMLEVEKAIEEGNSPFGAILIDENEVIRIKEDENSGVEWIDIDKAEEITNEEKMKPIYKKLNNKIKDYNL